MSSLLHFVTQWMSLVIDWLGSARNSSQLQRLGWSVSPVIEKDHSASGVRGVGPAESTGKSLVQYWPGGSLALSSVSRALPLNPRLTNFMGVDLLHHPGG